MNSSPTYSSAVVAVFRQRIRETNKSFQDVKTQSPLIWLKQHVSGIDIGEHFANALHPVHCNKNQRVLSHFAALARGDRSFLPYQLNWQQINAHCAGSRTCYFAGANEAKKKSTLVMIDVDCKRYGSWEGARQYLEHLRDNLFPNLYFERSTGGKGGHGYFVLEKSDCGGVLINPLLLDRLAPLLNNLAEGFDIEFVEIKGTMPVIEWGEKKFEVLGYKAGTLAKIPRGLVSHFEELRNTTRISVDALLRLPIPDDDPKVGTGNRTVPGSISGKHFDQQTLDSLKNGGRFRTVAEVLLSAHILRTSGRMVVTVEDIAITLMIGEWLTKNICPNGAMPTKRWEKLWTALSKSEDIGRAWDNKRFAVIRNFLSSLGLIDWEDKSYERGWHTIDGNYVKGRAAKWRFSAELMERIAEVEITEEVEETAVSASTNKREEGEHPLWEQQLLITTRWAISLTRLPEKETIRPVEVDPIQLERLDPGYVTQFVGYFEALAV